MNLPSAFEDKMKKILGEEFPDYIACYEEPRYYGLRVNTQKISPAAFEQICPFEIRRIPWIDNGFYYDGETVSPARHPYYFAGLYYLQEPSAMTPANRLPVKPGDKVLDLCAAPGGKATELGAKLRGKGLLVANDISSSRAKGLLKNIELFGIGNVLVSSEEPGRLAEFFTGFFDKILIDAPCSGEGMFRKDKKMVKAWEEHGPSYFSKIQKNIILQAADMLAPGGMMLYSTCTFDPSENEEVIRHLLKNRCDLHLCPIHPYEGFTPGMPHLVEDGDPSLSETVRIFPHKMHGEGHFLALLEKDGELSGCCNHGQTGLPRKGKKKLPEELTEFLGKIKIDLSTDRLDIHGERVYYMPEGLPDIRGIRFLRTGLLLGEIKKNRFEPSQALAMYLSGTDFNDILNFSSRDERVIRYLKGETLDVDDLVTGRQKGWHLVCVDGYSLGWGKLSAGTLKNKYLPGWRWQSV